MDKINIIFANRKDCFEKSGGDTIQMTKTKEYLEKLYPVEIKICLTPEEIMQDDKAEIVHIFNLETINETNAFIKAAKEKNKKVVLSTIHWNFLEEYYVKYLEALKIHPINCPTIFKKLLIYFFNIFIFLIPALKKKYERYIEKGMYCTNRYIQTRKYALENADLLLPNSTEEMYLCADDFNLNRRYIANKTVVVPNATEIISQINNQSDENNIKLPEKYVIIAGRIDSTKNQYNLIRALANDKDIKIIVVGRVQSEVTYSRIKKLSDKTGNVIFIPQTEQANLIRMYKNAICHVLPSFYDTTGLVNLEAMLLGCPIVVSDSRFCPVEYYEFNKYGEVCNPYDPKSIRDAIFKIIAKNERVTLSPEYLYKISYENVAKLTFEAYQSILN